MLTCSRYSQAKRFDVISCEVASDPVVRCETVGDAALLVRYLNGGNLTKGELVKADQIFSAQTQGR